MISRRANQAASGILPRSNARIHSREKIHKSGQNKKRFLRHRQLL
jgi:hypothetical protein